MSIKEVVVVGLTLIIWAICELVHLSGKGITAGYKLVKGKLLREGV